MNALLRHSKLVHTVEYMIQDVDFSWAKAKVGIMIKSKPKLFVSADFILLSTSARQKSRPSLVQSNFCQFVASPFLRTPFEGSIEPATKEKPTIFKFSGATTKQFAPFRAFRCVCCSRSHGATYDSNVLHLINTGPPPLNNGGAGKK